MVVSSIGLKGPNLENWAQNVKTGRVYFRKVQAHTNASPTPFKKPLCIGLCMFGNAFIIFPGGIRIPLNIADLVYIGNSGNLYVCRRETAMVL